MVPAEESNGSSNGLSQGASHPPLNLLEVIGNAIVGGMESYVHNLVTHLPAIEFNIVCLCPYESAFTQALRRKGCTIFITPMRDDPAWCAIEMAVEVVRNFRIDLIHAHLLNAHTLAGLTSRLTAVPAVATIHTMTIPTQEACVARATGTHLITVCQQAYGQALALGIGHERVTHITNGVDIETFKLGRDRNQFRRAVGVPLDAPLVGFVGRLAWEKGPDKFVQMAGRVLQHRSDVHFVLVGEGPMEDEVRGLIERMKLADRIHLAGIWANTEAVYPAFDIFVQTSRSEAMPLAILEAMACGVPVAAIAVGGVAEQLEAGTTGILLQPGEWPGVASSFPGDWEGVASAVLMMLGHPALLKKMGEAGRQRVEEVFDLRASVQQTGALFQRLASPKQPHYSAPSAWPAFSAAAAYGAAEQPYP